MTIKDAIEESALELPEISYDSDSLYNYFFIEDYKQRKLFLNDQISQDSVGDIVRHIIQFNKEDKGKDIESRTPITLYLSSVGGDVDAGFELIDVMLNSKTPVYTVNLGFQYSIGFLIGLAGSKRYGTENAKYLMHDGTTMLYSSGSKVRDQMEFQWKIEERIKRYIISRSKLTEEEYNDKLRVEWYVFADEAKEKGFVDYIIGKDCDLDEVI